MAKREPPVLLIDADVFRYQMSYSNTKGIDWDGDGEITEVFQEDKARADVDSMIVELCKKFKAKDFVLALSCPHHNFRKDVLSTYKFVRHEKPKPQLWSLIDEHIQTKYADKIVMRYGLEGDDILGTLASHPSPKRAPGPRIVVSIDKDLQTIPGIRLYNPKKPELGLRAISHHDADYFWMYQTLAGDSTDGYAGCPRIGEKWATQALEPVHHALRDASPEDHLAGLWAAVVAVYERKKLTADDALIQARLARILRHGDLDYKTNKVKLWKF